MIAALATCFISIPVFAANTEDTSDKSTQLETVTVTAPKRRVYRRSNEVTGLGKIVKQAEQLEKEQVLNIRDLIRYEPGVSVVEQGRGGSSGFSIRGVDKNRVLVTVDGIPQLQSYVDSTSNSGGSGSMNEVEFENVSAIEINKGGNSAEAGSGSLGGSINYHTKNVSDFISDEEKNWGLTSKSIYSSKDKRFAQTLGGAFRYQGLEGLLQYTRRSGNEISIHRDAANKQYVIYRPDAYEAKYDLRYEPNLEAHNWFRFSDCNTNDCLKHWADITQWQLPTYDSRTEPYTEKEEAQRNVLVHRKEILSAKEYTGSERILPNPMKYQSGSWLARLGYQIAPAHYIGWLMERTQQNYDSRDMRYSAYYPIINTNFDTYGRLPILDKYNDPKYKSLNNSNRIWRNHPREGFAYLQWTRARFLEEKHSKLRNGFQYRYEPHQRSSWADSLELNLDKQNIKLDTATILAHCSPYPDYSTKINCQPSKDKPGSYLNKEQVAYKENHLLFNTKWNKKWQWGFSKHNFQATAGYDKFDSSFNKKIIEEIIYKNQNFDSEKRIINGKEETVYIYEEKEPVAITTYPCTDWNIPTCSRKPIKGKSYYFSVRDNMTLGKYFDLGLGLRLDRHSFRSDDPAIRNKTYTNRSWNVGFVFKPSNKWSFSYRISNGFRVPSFQELYGYNIPGVDRNTDTRLHYIADLEPEKSRNQEVGATYKGYFGNIELSVFESRYRDLIAHAITKPINAISKTGNFNIQNADLQGINLRSIIDLNGMWNKLPDGLSLNLAYNRIKAKRLFFNDDPNKFTWLSDYPLETIQPSRYVIGLNYDSPSDKWGMSMNWIHSRGKNPNELISKAYSGSGKTFNIGATNATTRPWTTFDLIGYYRPWKNTTLRAGVYNALNYRYLTWETVRQTSINTAATQQHGSDYKQFAAPGRNFTVGLEMKF